MAGVPAEPEELPRETYASRSRAPTARSYEAKSLLPSLGLPVR